MSSDPPGARVVLGAGVEGVTPFVARDLEPGAYVLEVSAPTFRPVREEIRIGPGDEVARSLKLSFLPVRLQLRTIDLVGALAFVDGQARGTLPATIEGLDPGRHEVRVERDGAEQWKQVLDLRPGEDRALDVQAPPPPPPAPLPVAASPLLDPAKDPFPVAVMVENAFDARPQSGLHAASIVYEALAEGGISRFMAVYMKGTSEAIGPVRSARDYFVKLAKELGAPLVHIGSSPRGFSALRSLGVISLDESAGDDGFWRSRARLAPHNAYVSTKSAREALAATARPAPGQYGGFVYKETATPVTGDPAPALRLDYGWDYTVDYRYLPESNTYARIMDERFHVDAETGQNLEAANVVVLTVPSEVVDQEGRLELAQVGEGKARLFLDGKVIEGRWQKTSLWAPTRFLDSAGKQVALNVGQTWVQMIPTTARVTY